MKLRNLKIGWRMLIQEPAYSAIVILGLSVGFATCLLLLGFVRYSWNYDAQIPNADQVMVVKTRMNFIPGQNPHIDANAKWWEMGPVSLVKLAQEIPEISDATAAMQLPAKTIRIGAQKRSSNILLTLPHFAKMLGIRAIEGDLASALERPEGLALTEDTAALWFGKTHALNQTLQIDGKLLRVMAIIPKVAANTTMPYTALVGLNSEIVPADLRAVVTDARQEIAAQVLLRLAPNIDVIKLTAILQQAVDSSTTRIFDIPPEIRQELKERKILDVKLAPLREAYFDQEVVGTPYSGPRGDKKMMFALAAIGMLILALAAINYVNLATVRVLRRQREIGMRKVLGARVSGIVTQFFAESLLVSLLAAGIGFMLAWLALPVFSDLVDRKLDGLFSSTNIAGGIMLSILVGILSGLQPGWVAWRVPLAQVLADRPNTESKRGTRLRWCLTVLQFATVIALAGIALCIAWQTKFASHADPGFDPRSLLIVDIAENLGNSPDARSFRAAIERLPGVTGVAVTSNAIGRNSMTEGAELRREGGAKVAIARQSVSPNFFAVYQIRPIAGRVHDARIDAETDWQNAVINLTAVRALGFASPQAAIGQFLYNLGGDGKIYHRQVIGVVNDIRHHSLRETPTAISYEPGNWTSVFTVRTRSTMPAAISETERAIAILGDKYFPNSITEIHRASDIFALNYVEDARLSKLLAASSCVALAIAGFGIYVLSVYSVRRRSREIVLRKLYGATRHDIARLVWRDSLAVIAAGMLIGLPIALIAAERYLSGFVERSPMGLWPTVMAALLAALLVLVASARQTFAAMRLSPVQIFRE